MQTTAFFIGLVVTAATGVIGACAVWNAVRVNRAKHGINNHPAVGH